MAGERIIPTYKIGAESPDSEDVNADQHLQQQGMKNDQSAQGSDQQGTDQGKDTNTPPDKFKDKSPEQVVEMYQNLEKKMGEQSKELGQMRKMMQQMESSQQTQVDQGQQTQQQADDFMTQMQSIQDQVENGEIDVAQGIAQASQLTMQQAASQFDQRLQEYDQSRTAQEMQSKFSTDHPDFAELKDNGTLEQYMQANPMHDEFSAYFAHKADENAKAIEQAKEEGKQEAQRLAQGADQQRTVLSKPGATVRQAQQRQTGPLSEPEIVQGQLAAMKRVRGDA